MKSYSQAHQDTFVITCLDKKREGFFLDLGCNHPVEISNTYLLEKEYGWQGISIDIDRESVNRFQGVRSCEAICADCTKIDYNAILKGRKHVDYLSLDLEPASVTFDCLKRIPLDSIKFSIITYEHDEYRFGPDIKNQSREILTENGYYLLCRDVKNSGCSYEDWYVHPDYVNLEKVKRLSSIGMDHNAIANLFNL